MISFIVAVYNEENEIVDLLDHINDWVDIIAICDDGSTDDTIDRIQAWIDSGLKRPVFLKKIQHIGLPETVKNEALLMVPNDLWVLMLDADERFITPLQEIVEWIKSPASEEVDYVYFDQYEVIDGEHVRTFQKCKLFRRDAIQFPQNDIHKDDTLIGRGAYFGWQVIHRKGSYKQIQREQEYLQTYKKLLDEGKIDQGRYEWLKGLHHYVR